jgi:hypothetical protein
MLKIGILTYHGAYNFGANLQALANQRYLQALGHEVWIIDYRKELEIGDYDHVPKEQAQAHEAFLVRELHLTKRCMTRQDLQDCCREHRFDHVLVGSDAVWSIPSWWDFSEGLPVFFMDWLFEMDIAQETKVSSISVAHMGSGFGHLPQEIQDQLKAALNRFHVINVRDHWTRQAVLDLIGPNKPVGISADPVFSLEPPTSISRLDGDYVLVTPSSDAFLVGWLEEFRALANARGIKVIELPIPDRISNMKLDGVLGFPLDPLDWFSALTHARGFVGIRFHAIVSSIAGGVPFFSVDSYGSGTLITRILNRLKFHRLGCMFDTKSKIFQLLKGSKFSGNRVGGFRPLTGISPATMLDTLLGTKRQDVLDLRAAKLESYASGIHRIFQ